MTTQGWHGDTPGHKAAATKNKLSDTARTPMVEPESEYERQANTFLNKHGITFKVTKYKQDECPLWCDGKGHIHGRKHLVSFRKDDAALVTFNFWNSYKDAQAGKQPKAYDVLSGIQKNDPGDFKNFCDDFGYEQYEEDMRSGGMKTNKKALTTYKAVKKEWEKVSGFFTKEELEELYDIN